MKKALFFFVGLVFWMGCKTTGGLYEHRVSSNEGDVPGVADFMQDALYNGLMRDQFPKDLLAKLMEEPNVFVPKCPICRPTEEGMKDYMNEDGTPKATDKLPATLLANLQSKDLVTKQYALRDLITRYTTWHKLALGLNEANTQALNQALASARKQGMGSKPSSFGEFCPSCDGACEIK